MRMMHDSWILRETYKESDKGILLRPFCDNVTGDQWHLNVTHMPIETENGGTPSEYNTSDMYLVH